MARADMPYPLRLGLAWVLSHVDAIGWPTCMLLGSPEHLDESPRKGWTTSACSRRA